LIQRQHSPVNVVGGHRFPAAPEIDLGTIPTITDSPPIAPIVDGLDIPEFLLRDG
jgi:hypothetical protein